LATRSPQRTERFRNFPQYLHTSISDWLQTERPGFDRQQRQRIFSLASCVQASYEAHPASCTLGTRGPLPGGKARTGRDANHSPHLVSWSRMSRDYTSFPLWLVHGIAERLYFTPTQISNSVLH
jgi:hypothetical protein